MWGKIVFPLNRLCVRPWLVFVSAAVSSGHGQSLVIPFCHTLSPNAERRSKSGIFQEPFRKGYCHRVLSVGCAHTFPCLSLRSRQGREGAVGGPGAAVPIQTFPSQLEMQTGRSGLCVLQCSRWLCRGRVCPALCQHWDTATPEAHPPG